MSKPPPPDQKSLVGYTIGKCKLLRICGRGAMGTVYKGLHQGLDIDVAVKVLPPHLAVNSNLVERFLREAKLAARLNHANAVRVYDVGEESGYYYLIMEYIDGTDALELLHRHGPQPAIVVADIGAGAARAIEEAHKCDVIHRDIKPANLMLPNSGGVKVADFGLARALASESGLTMTGAVMGTPDYMAPEQAQGAPVGPLADIYSLGATLFHLFVGRPPFQGATPMAVALQHVTSRIIVPEHLIRDDAGRRLSRMIHELTQKDPAQRPSDLSQVSAQLMEIARINRRTNKLLSEGATLYATAGLRLDTAAINKEKAEEAVAALDKGRVESPHLERLRRAAEKARAAAGQPSTGTGQGLLSRAPRTAQSTGDIQPQPTKRLSSAMLPIIPPDEVEDTTRSQPPASAPALEPAEPEPEPPKRPITTVAKSPIIQSPEREAEGWQSYAAKSFPTAERKSIMRGSPRAASAPPQTGMYSADSHSSSMNDYVAPITVSSYRRPRRRTGGAGLLMLLLIIGVAAGAVYFLFLRPDETGRRPVEPGTGGPVITRYQGAERGGIQAMVAQRDMPMFYTGSGTGELRKWRIGATTPENSVRLERGITALALGTRGRGLAVGTAGGEVFEFDENNLSVLRTHTAQLEGAEATSLVFPSPGVIFVGDSRGRVRKAGESRATRVAQDGSPVRGLLWHGSELWAAAGTTLARFTVTEQGLELRDSIDNLPAAVAMLTVLGQEVYAAFGNRIQRLGTDGPQGPSYEAAQPFLSVSADGRHLVVIGAEGVEYLDPQSMQPARRVSIERMGTPASGANISSGNRTLIGTRAGEIIEISIR